MKKITVAAIAGSAIAAALFGAGSANADPTSTLTAQGTVRSESAGFSQAPETVYPREGCRYWEKSTVSNNQNALQRFHAGFASFIIGCGGDGA